LAALELELRRSLLPPPRAAASRRRSGAGRAGAARTGLPRGGGGRAELRPRGHGAELVRLGGAERGGKDERGPRASVPRADRTAPRMARGSSLSILQSLLAHPAAA